MRSLRSRLGALISGGAFVVTLGASVAIAVERWQEENITLTNDVELAAFQLSESQAPTTTDVPVSAGTDAFALVLDASAGVLDQGGKLTPGLLDSLIDDVWSETTEQDTAVTVEYEIDGRRLVATGVACVNQSRCDSVIVGAVEEGFVDYLSARWFWLIGPAAVAAVMAWAATRWLVRRSLRPVDQMRQELELITATDLERRVLAPSTGDELERLGVTLNQTIARLGAAVSANERFVADAAHELRSPITGVRAALEIEASRSPDSIIDDSVRELDRASNLIDDLLLLARHQGEAPKLGDVDLDDIVRCELEALGERFPGVDVEHRIEPVRLSGDTDSLRRAVKNLLENACRHGGQHVAVTVGQDGDWCRLLVDDDGPGVPSEHHDVIFERFARLDASRSRETGGAGLGLAIVKEIVADHRGTVTVNESSLGGAQFEVALPVD